MHFGGTFPKPATPEGVREWNRLISAAPLSASDRPLTYFDSSVQESGPRPSAAALPVAQASKSPLPEIQPLPSVFNDIRPLSKPLLI